MEVCIWRKKSFDNFCLLTPITSSPAVSKIVVLRCKQVLVFLRSVITVGGAVRYDANILKLFGDTFNAIVLFTLVM